MSDISTRLRESINDQCEGRRIIDDELEALIREAADRIEYLAREAKLLPADRGNTPYRGPPK